MIRRLADLLTSGTALLLLGVPFLAIGALIRLSSPGPVFYRQARVGRLGRRFVLYKFRSMRTDCPGPTVTAEGDPRVTPIGVFIRRWKIDELPQLWNVFRGEMSIVGPRPEVEKFVRGYSTAELEILNAKPGLASMAQLVYPHESELLRGAADPEGFYAIQLLPRKLAVDLEYERRRSLATDAWLLVQLLLMILGRRDHVDPSVGEG